MPCDRTQYVLEAGCLDIQGRYLAEVILRSLAPAKASRRYLSCSLGSGRNKPFRVNATEQHQLFFPETLFVRFAPRTSEDKCKRSGGGDTLKASQL